MGTPASRARQVVARLLPLFLVLAACPSVIVAILFNNVWAGLIAGAVFFWACLALVAVLLLRYRSITRRLSPRLPPNAGSAGLPAISHIDLDKLAAKLGLPPRDGPHSPGHGKH